MTVLWENTFPFTEGKSLEEYVKALLADGKSRGEIAKLLVKHEIPVTRDAVIGKARRMRKKSAAVEKTLAPRKRKASVQSFSGDGSIKLPSVPHVAEDHETEGVGFTDIVDGQCRHTLRGEGINIVYCGRATGSRRKGRCDLH